MNYLEEYWNLIKNGEVVVGYWIKTEVRNLIRDLKDPRFIYDTTEAHKRIRFQESCCLQSKAPYYMQPIKLMPWEKAWWEAVYSFKMADTGQRRFTEGLLKVARKNGKDLDENTRIPTPKGDKILKNISVGDYVYGINGNPVKVLGVKTFTDQTCYKITFEDGEQITCGAGHLWYVKDKNSERKYRRGTIANPFKAVETETMLQNFAKERADGKGKEYFYRIPLAKAVEYEAKELPIKPYTLGAWLGDGGKNTSYITCGELDFLETVSNLKDDGYLVSIKENNGQYKIGVNEKEKRTILPLIHKLGIYDTKHIPEIYFYSSVEQRKELLKGLMDTDGTVSKSGECEWVQKSETLTKDFSRLLTSLGIKHSVIHKNAKCNGKDCGIVHRVTFYVDVENSCFKLKRKHNRLKRKLNKRMYSKSIINIEKTETVKTKCLCVDGGLFLCGERNTVTHNSTMFAADGNYDLFCGAGGTDICCASNDDRQARLIWNELAGMRSRLDPKKAITGQNLTEIKNKLRNITVFRLSSKTQNKDGFNISKTYLDESHDIAEENGQSEIAEACWRGMSSKDEPLFLNCTTEGFNRDCYLDKKTDYAKKVIAGEIEDINFIAFLFEQDSELEIWQDETTWEKSNPAIRYGVKKITKLRRDIETAKIDKATRIHMLTKDFNIPQSAAVSWLMLEDYDYTQEPIDLESFRGSFALGVVDLSATTDLTNARVLLMKPGDKTKYMITRYFIPESKLEDSDDKAAGAAYAEWAKNDLLTIHDGNEVNIAAVADWFYSLYKSYGIKLYKIGYDQRYAKEFLSRCEEYGFETEMLQQGRALSNAMKLCEADLKSRVINYNNNVMDKWNLKNCCCEVDNVGNIQPVKSKGQKNKRIDGAVTMIMLEELYRRYRSDYMNLIGG